MVTSSPPPYLRGRTRGEAPASGRLPFAPGSPGSALQEINRGLDSLRAIFEEYEAEEHFEDDELVSRLTDLRETLRREYQVGRTLQEQLADAVAAEEYELAARLRDELARRRN